MRQIASRQHYLPEQMVVVKPLNAEPLNPMAFDALSRAGRPNYWNQPLCADLHREVDPFSELQLFRPLTKAYDGQTTFWEIPSPEPDLPDSFWNGLGSRLTDWRLPEAGARLAASLLQWEPNPEKMVLVAILRAGVPIADWLTRLLPGAIAVQASLFSGLGLDQIALTQIKHQFPDRRIVFVDGWTGRGGVARELARWNAGPLAVLLDPWGWADFSGAAEDTFSPSACFTGPSTLGFSRTFFVGPDQLFGAYAFPQAYIRKHLIDQWRAFCPIQPDRPFVQPERFFQSTELRIHSNEVCRALINASPEVLMFRVSKADSREQFSLLLELADQRRVPVRFDCHHLADLKTNVACTLRKDP
ncbi:MAG: hypothetical protein HY774_08035 [Acidobacteria bacterium]|nr:hypothetical protein [Acidobacteriota bacterium]